MICVTPKDGKVLNLTGDDVIVHPSVKTEEAKQIWPELKIVKPYLRFTPLAKDQTSAA